MTVQERKLEELGLVERADIRHYRWYPFELGGLELLDQVDAPDCRPDPRGGLTVVDIILDDGRTYTGTATCSMRDNYNKRIGRAIAIGRALKDMEADEQKNN